MLQLKRDSHRRFIGLKAGKTAKKWVLPEDVQAVIQYVGGYLASTN